ncbi:MAG TPA: peptide ABC transporter substrate-binding protein [Bacillota bacterium]|nr:peptide ABC transporter substrate-binding protein [Bacillota bacterium]
MKKFFVFMLVAALVLGLVACSTPGGAEKTEGTAKPDSEETEPAEVTEPDETDAPDDEPDEPATDVDKILRYALTADPESFDPSKAHGIPSATICYHIYEGLYRDVDGDLQPACAENYDVADDQVTYTFYLRDDIKWSDGEPVTANDFEYGIKRFLDPETAAPMGYMGTVIKNGAKVSAGELPLDDAGIKAIDEKTLEIVLESPADYFLSMLSKSFFAPQRKDVVEEFGQDYCAKPENQVYNGAFMVTEFGEGKIAATKNPYYHEIDKIKLDGFEVLTVKEPNTQLAMFENGELDFVTLSTDIAPNYADRSKSYFDGAVDFGGPNLNNKYLANKDLRLALNYALNREEYILLSHNGLYTPDLRYVMPKVHGVDGDYGTEYPLEAYPLQGDLDMAKDYLDKAMAELGLTDPSEISLKMVVTDSDSAKKEAEVLQNQWQTNLGIVVEINLVPYATKNSMLTPNNDEFDIILSGWVADYPDPYSYLELFHSESAYNYVNYKSEEFDKYLDASQETSGKERMDNLFNAEKVLLEDGAVIPQQLREVQYLEADGLTGLMGYFVGINFNYLYADKN